MDRQRLMPGGHWTWRGGQWSTISQGWRVGNLVFVGGQVAIDEHGEVIAPGDIEVQTRAVYVAIERVLREAGAELADVVKINSYLVTDAEGEEFDEFWRKMAAVRRDFFPVEGPCGTGVIVSSLVYPGLVIEVEAIAAIPDDRLREHAAT
jgi:enamine deaminase RidA (YjgF/YER057c/UK114 family)